MSTNVHEWGNVTVSLGWSASPGFVGRLIRRFDTVQWCGQEYNSQFNHVFWVFDFERGPSLIYESHVRGGVQVTPFEQLEQALSEKRIMYYYLRDLNLDQASAVALWESCRQLHGRSYDLLHLLGILWWIKVAGRLVNSRPRWIEKLLDKFYICSELTEAAARLSKKPLDLCGEISTPVTTSPESQFVVLVGLPSQITYCPGMGQPHRFANWHLNTRTAFA